MTTFAALLLLGVLGFSIHRVWRTVSRPWPRTALVILRLLLAAILLCALFEPSLRFTKLKTERTGTCVLLDVSASMSMFQPDTGVARLLAFLRDSLMEHGDGDGPPVKVLWFGDSLRVAPRGEYPRFGDRRSTFPRLPHDLSRTLHETIIISDGNWSGKVDLSGPIKEKECSYVPLTLGSPHRHLSVRCPDDLPYVAADSSSPAKIIVEGFSSQRATVALVCRTRGGRLVRRSVPVDSGFFSKAVSLSIPARVPGVHLIEIEASLSEDSTHSTCYTLQRVTDGTVFIHTYAASPSLDKRFLTLALKRHTDWHIADVSGDDDLSETDLLVLFDWNATARNLVDSLPGRACVLCIGCLPCPEVKSTPVSSWTLAPGELLDPVMAQWVGMLSLPPATYVACTKALAGHRKTILEWKGDARTGEREIGPVLFETRTKGRPHLALPVRGFWQWDFRPLLLTKNRNTPFSALLVHAMRQFLERNINQSFYCYPVSSPVSESDSVAFRILLPRALAGDDPEKAHVTMVAGATDTIRTGWIECRAAPGATSAFTLPPLEKHGRYRYTCTVNVRGRSLSYTDSLTIAPDDSEFRAQGQNTLLLGQMAHPLNTGEALERLRTARRMKRSRTGTSTQVIRLEQSWFMLLVLFGLFAMEWVLRRAWSLD